MLENGSYSMCIGLKGVLFCVSYYAGRFGQGELNSWSTTPLVVTI